MELHSVKLHEHIETLKGFAFKSIWYQPEGAPIVRVSDFTMESISLEKIEYIDFKLAKSYDKYQLKENDVVIQTVGSWQNNPASVVGKVIRVPKALNGALLNQNAVKIIPKKTILNSYLFYILKNENFKNYILGCAQGAANQASITLNSIGNYIFPLPPLKTQQKIASFLSNYDDLIENNTQRIKLLESMAEELYKEWFVRLRFPGHEEVEVVDGVPEGWKKNTLNNICEITSSKRIFLSDYTSEGIPFYRGKEITLKSKNELVESELFISNNKFYDINKNFGSPSVDDILITAVGTLGSIYLVKKSDGNFYFKDGNLIWLKKFKNKFSLYIYYFCKSVEFQHFIDGFAIGSSQKALTIDALKKCPFLYPNIDIVKKFNIHVKAILNEIEILNLKNDELKQTRDLLLPRLMSGKLNVEDLDII